MANRLGGVLARMCKDQNLLLPSQGNDFVIDNLVHEL